jgi:hypothetical protein
MLLLGHTYEPASRDFVQSFEAFVREQIIGGADYCRVHTSLNDIYV